MLGLGTVKFSNYILFETCSHAKPQNDTWFLQCLQFTAYFHKMYSNSYNCLWDEYRHAILKNKVKLKKVMWESSKVKLKR